MKQAFPELRHPDVAPVFHECKFCGGRFRFEHKPIVLAPGYEGTVPGYESTFTVAPTTVTCPVADLERELLSARGEAATARRERDKYKAAYEATATLGDPPTGNLEKLFEVLHGAGLENLAAKLGQGLSRRLNETDGELRARLRQLVVYRSP